MSVKQLVETEKKICLLSLLQQQALLCGLNLINLDILSLRHLEICNVASEDLLWLVEVFSNAPADELSSTDANMSYFVSGYVGKSVQAAKNVFLASHCLFQDIILRHCMNAKQKITHVCMKMLIVAACQSLQIMLRNNSARGAMLYSAYV